MDAFDPIRVQAVELHKRAVIRGAIAHCGKSLVKAALKCLDLELVCLNPGDPALKGAIRA